MLPLIQHAIPQDHPHYIVLHFGANDIGRIDASQWHKALRATVATLQAKYPQSVLIYSDMLPRKTWRYGPSSVAANSARKRFQRRARGIFFKAGGSVIRHPRLEHNLGLLAPDGVHLTEAGLETFIADLEQGLTSLILGTYPN